MQRTVTNENKRVFIETCMRDVIRKSGTDECSGATVLVETVADESLDMVQGRPFVQTHQ
jgi:hypothetical protein